MGTGTRGIRLAAQLGLSLSAVAALGCSENFQDIPLPVSSQRDTSKSNAAPDADAQEASNDSTTDAVASDAEEAAIRIDLGEHCTDNARCKSGICADGVCCQMLCGGCNTCNQPGFEGTCKPATDGTDPHGTCAGSAASCKGVCDGVGRCRWPSASFSCGDARCDLTGMLLVQPTCNKRGECVDKARSCGAYRCNSSASGCFSDCGANGGCAADAVCTTGTCTVMRSVGASCASSANCATGFCVDGVCCDRACEGTCEACNKYGYLGLCTAHGSGEDPEDECAGDTAPCGGVCNGDSACMFAPISRTCGENVCMTLPSQSHLFTCDGRGQCAESLSDCAPYQCDANHSTCSDQCKTKVDCSQGYRCEGSKCVAE